MLLVLGGLWIGQNVNLLPVDASVNAPIYDELFRVLFSIGTILFVGIVGLIVFSLVRFRRRPGQIGDGLALEGNLPLEVFWTAVPAIVVLFVGLYSYDIYERMGGMVPWAMGTMDPAARQRNASGEASAPHKILRLQPHRRSHRYRLRSQPCSSHSSSITQKVTSSQESFTCQRIGPCP